MILVDTSVWVDHLRGDEPLLRELLADDGVMTHEGVVQELALGSIQRRHDLIALLNALRRAPTLRHDELLTFVEHEHLWSRGLSVIDVQILGSARVAGSAIWTRDRRLRTAAHELGIDVLD